MVQTAGTIRSESMTFTRPTWAEISGSRLLQNYRLLRRLAGPRAELLAVVKADAYGHGGAECARMLTGGGARWFGVTCVEEAVALRRSCPVAGMLAMSGLWYGEAEAAIEHRITPAVWEPLHLELLDEAARRLGLGRGAIPVHLEIDSGMSRQGVQLSGLDGLLGCLAPDSPLRIEAVMTHFHSAENPEPTQEQMRAFAAAVDTIVGRGWRPEILSAGSSASALQQDTEMVTDLAERVGARRMLRPGIALYGYTPTRAQAGASKAPERDLAPVLAWKTRVVTLRTIEAGVTAGYDATFRAQRRTRLALLPVGYADGLSRLLSNRGWVLVRGQRAPMAGRISMDQTIVDVTDVPGVAMGDEVVLIGEQEGKSITAADVAELTGTIPYEVLCAIASRVPRVMVD